MMNYFDVVNRSIHLSNVAVQENYVNGKRSDNIPENNFMTSDQLKEYLWCVRLTLIVCLCVCLSVCLFVWLFLEVCHICM